MNLQPIFIREEVVKAIRSFFETRHFHEVIVPVFNEALPLEPTLYSFSSRWHTRDGSKTFYLTVSPESGLKKMMGEGIGNCYAIGKCFRNLEGSGPQHNPEFLMLEWYRENAHYTDIMNDTEALLLHIKKHLDVHQKKTVDSRITYKGVRIDLQEKWERLSLEDLFRRHTGVKMKDIVSDKTLRYIMKKNGYTLGSATWEQLFDQLFLNEVEPHLPKSSFFLTDFPARLSPLCTRNAQKPYLAERFECYLAGMEIGNGNNENTDAHMVYTQFLHEKKTREERHEVYHPIDASFINALQKMNETGKHFAGIGVGVDRLAMIFADTQKITDVEYFAVLSA